MKQNLKKPWSFSNLISLLQKHLLSYVKFRDFFDHVDQYVKDDHKNKGTPEESAQQLKYQKFDRTIRKHWFFWKSE